MTKSATDQANETLLKHQGLDKAQARGFAGDESIRHVSDADKHRSVLAALKPSVGKYKTFINKDGKPGTVTKCGGCGAGLEGSKDRNGHAVFHCESPSCKEKGKNVRLSPEHEEKEMSKSATDQANEFLAKHQGLAKDEGADKYRNSWPLTVKNKAGEHVGTVNEAHKIISAAPGYEGIKPHHISKVSEHSDDHGKFNVDVHDQHDDDAMDGKGIKIKSKHGTARLG